MLVTEFFNNTLGSWESHRTYMYPSTNKIKTLVTYFHWTILNKDTYTVTWESCEGKGAMNIILSSDNMFKRNVGYFTNKETISNILDVSPLNLTTSTSYNNMTFKETIEFLGLSHRTRRTIGYKNNSNVKNEVILSGSYQEFKIS